jgi:hypothetical protein
MSEIVTLFERFGGTRKMAEALSEPASTVQSWKTAGRIPAAKQPEVLAKARDLQLEIAAEDIIFPLGRPATTPDHSASATNAAENICRDEGEADSPRPFSSATVRPADSACAPRSLPTCSPTSAPLAPSAVNRVCSAGSAR